MKQRLPPFARNAYTRETFHMQNLDHSNGRRHNRERISIPQLSDFLDSLESDRRRAVHRSHAVAQRYGSAKVLSEPYLNQGSIPKSPNSPRRHSWTADDQIKPVAWIDGTSPSSPPTPSWGLQRRSSGSDLVGFTELYADRVIPLTLDPYPNKLYARPSARQRSTKVDFGSFSP